MRVSFSSALLIASLTLGACGVQKAKPDSLFAQLGGEPMLRAIASDTIDTVADSADGQRAFEAVKRPRVKKQLYEFLCVTADGPCQYRGAEMERVHRGLKITEREFANLVEVFRRTMEKHGVAAPARNELLRRLAPLQRIIVTAQRDTPARGMPV